MEPKEESEARLYIGRGIHPAPYEICAVSFDNEGTPGPLNRFVWNALKLTPAQRPSRSDLLDGFTFVHSKSLVVVCVVTIDHDNRTVTRDLLENNLNKALQALLNNLQDYPTALWLPLMGTGSGGLSHAESARITLRVLAGLWDRFSAKSIQVALALGSDLPDSVVQQIIYQAETYTFDIEISSDLGNIRRGTSRIETEFDSSAEQVSGTSTTTADRAAPRPFSDDLPTFTDAASDEPKLNFPEIARKLVNLVKNVTTESPADTTKNSERDNLWLAAKDARLTVGIFAPWGAGKSTLVRALRRTFHSDGFHVFSINPWKWDGKSDLHDFVRQSVLEQADLQQGLKKAIAGLRVRQWLRAHGHRLCLISVVILIFVLFGNQIEAFLKSLSASQTHVWDPRPNGVLVSLLLSLASILALPPLAKWVADRVANLLDKIMIGGVPQKLGADGLSEVYRDISRLLSRQGNAFKPFIFFIDDLDRCQPERITMILESVHSLTSTGCVAFIACDDEFVSASITVQYDKLAKIISNGGEFGRHYLEKIVQVSYRLPFIRSSDLYDLGLAEKFQTSGEAQTTLHKSNTQRRAEVHKTTARQSLGETVARKEDQIDPTKLREIVAQLFDGIVEPLALNIRQIKSITNTIKLYLEIYQAANDQVALSLAAFVLADRYDRDWLNAIYLGSNIGSGPIAGAAIAATRLRNALGDDTEQLTEFYYLLGRPIPSPRLA